MPLTEDLPKCFAEIGGKRILDWALEAFCAAGLRDSRRVRAGQPD